jgi:hypothetical protein
VGRVSNPPAVRVIVATVLEREEKRALALGLLRTLAFALADPKTKRAADAVLQPRSIPPQCWDQQTHTYSNTRCACLDVNDDEAQPPLSLGALLLPKAADPGKATA